jgi:hypothetical protein
LKSETQVQAAIKKGLANIPGLRLFRNNNGVTLSPNGNPIRYGLGNGSSDLVGWRTVVITPDMVGQKVAVFTALEVKKPGARTEKKHLAEQVEFIEALDRAGGIAGFVESLADAMALFGYGKQRDIVGEFGNRRGRR